MYGKYQSKAQKAAQQIDDLTYEIETLKRDMAYFAKFGQTEPAISNVNRLRIDIAKKELELKQLKVSK